MREKLNSLDKEDLVGIIERIYDVHQKDAEHHAAKDDKLLRDIHETRVARIEHYVVSALRRKNEKADNGKES